MLHGVIEPRECCLLPFFAECHALIRVPLCLVNARHMFILTVLILLTAAILLADAKQLLIIVFSLFFPGPSRSLQRFLVGSTRSLRTCVSCFRLFLAPLFPDPEIGGSVEVVHHTTRALRSSQSIFHCLACVCVPSFGMGELILASHVTHDHFPGPLVIVSPGFH